MTTTTSQQSQQSVAKRLLEQAGTTYARESGITVSDKPMPLFELLVLALLLSTRISAEIAVRAAAELRSSGLTTARHMADADRQTIIAALGRAHYRRYDESTATRLHDDAELVLEKYHGDLRKLASQSGNDAETAAQLLEEFSGIGPVGADIFLREVQDVWTWVRPYFDSRALDAARSLHLPADADKLASLVGNNETARLAAALIRASLDDELREKVLH
ncbi:endonuclease [Rhodococcus globerulus]|uniref:endonuclease n=1 Tax=Rhodococcus globerulus TaxID=33008 RepID=UPI000A683B1F|nr:endonuclease [Rhodococcus globerulus]